MRNTCGSIGSPAVWDSDTVKPSFTPHRRHGRDCRPQNLRIRARRRGACVVLQKQRRHYRRLINCPRCWQTRHLCGCNDGDESGRWPCERAGFGSSCRNEPRTCLSGLFPTLLTIGPRKWLIQMRRWRASTNSSALTDRAVCCTRFSQATRNSSRMLMKLGDAKPGI